MDETTVLNTEAKGFITNVAKVVDESADPKEILQFFCHPRTCQQYVDIKLCEHCSTRTEIIKGLFLRYIHHMHTDFLRHIVASTETV